MSNHRDQANLAELELLSTMTDVQITKALGITTDAHLWTIVKAEQDGRAVVRAAMGLPPVNATHAQWNLALTAAAR